MDCRRAVAAFLILLTASAAPLPLREAGWIAPDRRATALVAAPAECVSAAEQRDPAVRIGYVLFRDPLLLGGQAARAGLSCASCHRNGRSNPDFLFPGVSSGPGTADVTNALFGVRRGDGMFNPVPIPDLAAPGKVSRSVPGALEGFIRGLIVEEFDGPEPDPEALAGLSAYVRAVRAGPCRSAATVPVRLSDEVRTYALALDAAKRAQAQGSFPLAAQLAGAARAALGRIAERYGENEQAQLAALSRILAEYQQALRQRSGAVRAPTSRETASLFARLAAREPHSLYAAKRIANHLGRERTVTGLSR